MADHPPPPQTTSNRRRPGPSWRCLILLFRYLLTQLLPPRLDAQSVLKSSPLSTPTRTTQKPLKSILKRTNYPPLPPSNTQISSLPPELLSHILNHPGNLPLSTRINLRSVCRLWQALLEDSLSKQTRLVLCKRNAGQGHLDHNLVRTLPTTLRPSPDDLRLRKAHLTPSFLSLLGRLFPLVDSLTLHFGSLPSSGASGWSLLPALLSLYASSLTSLSLHGYHRRTSSSTIIKCLNSLPSLTSLHLASPHRLLLPHLTPTLSRLTHFSTLNPHTYSRLLFGVDWRDPHYTPAVVRALSTRATHLHLAYDDFVYLQIDRLTKKVGKHLTHLHLLYVPFYCLEEKLLSRLSHLECLTLHFMDKRPLDASLLRHLQPLRRLTHLTLLNLPLDSPLDPWTSMEPKAPLSSVRHLTLEFRYFALSPKPSTFYTSLTSWFPRLSNFTMSAPGIALAMIQQQQRKEALPYTVKLVKEPIDFTATRWH